MQLNHSIHNQKGFTLVEIALVMAIIGVITAASIRFAVPLIETANHLSTTEKMNKVAEALALYAVENNRIPCPAVPVTTTANPFSDGFGYEQNNGTAQPAAASRCGTASNALRGIVPFKTLEIPEDFIKDAWGNYFTYAVSPAFTLPTSAGSGSVHARCRTREWFYQLTRSPTYRHRNPAKAAFCCPGDTVSTAGTTSNLIVRDNANNDVLFRSRNRPMTGSNEVGSASALIPNVYNDMADPGYNPSSNPDRFIPVSWTPLGVAYVLVSHGRNGANTGFNGTANIRGTIPSSATSPCEEENANDATGDRIYRDCELSEDTATNANDDLTLWRTQDMIFASEGQSCATP